jgi:hypothetical protein
MEEEKSKRENSMLKKRKPIMQSQEKESFKMMRTFTPRGRSKTRRKSTLRTSFFNV